MSRFSLTAPGVRPLRAVAPIARSRAVFAAAIFLLAVSAPLARTETPEEVEKILAFLKTEKCEILRDAMGAKKLSVDGSNFTVEAKCADGTSYRFTLDQNFKAVKKETGNF